MSAEKPFILEMDVYGIGGVFLKRVTKDFKTAEALATFWEKNRKHKKQKSKKQNESA